MREALIRFIVKHPWVTAATAAMFAGITAALVAVTGVMPIRASSGHWPITARLLDFAKVQSVKTYSIGIDAPPLDDDALVMRGARHYDLGCSPCHGSPAAAVPPVMQAMTPPPPELRGEHVTRWTPEQLFSIVKHGIKFTGMPGWPVQQRDDEVWALVAFLRRLPEMDGPAYQRLAAGGTSPPLPLAAGLDAPRPVRDVCWRCHGPDGTSSDGGAFPSLAGQRASYLDAALRSFASRNRFSGTMVEIASKLSGEEIREISAYYQRLPPRVAAPSPATADGHAIATMGVVEREIPACIECHGPSAAPKNPAYPILAGQHAPYLVRQLELLKQRRRGGSPRVNIMHAVVDRLTAGEIRAVARYYESLNAFGQ